MMRGINKRMTVGGKEHLFLAAIMLAASVLLFANLGNTYLWQDEAETALISKAILKAGIPLGYDGKNFFSQAGEVAYGKDHIWVLDPWMPYYLSALFFKIFGISTLIARAPFALFGIATILLTYFFTKSIRRDKKTAALAATLLLFSVPFLIMSRQCRYYVLIAFFSMLGLYGYLMLLERKKAGSVIFLISAVLIFHCNQLFCAVLLATVFTHALLCERRDLARVSLLSLIIVIVNIPWIIWVSGMRYIDLCGYPRLLNREFFRFLYSYFCHIHNFIFPFYLLLISAGWIIFLIFRGLDEGRSIRQLALKDMLLWKNLLLLFLFIAFTVTALSILSPDPFFRYLTQLIPVFCVIAAVTMASMIRPYFKTAIIIIAISLGAVFFADYRYEQAHPGKQGIRYLNFFDYLYEITHDYDGPIEGIVKYLRENGKEQDTVAIALGDLPLKFYTEMRVVGELTKEDFSPAREADWVIIRKYRFEEVSPNLTKYIIKNVPLKRYSKIIIDYPDIAFENRPSPYHHRFRTAEDEDRVVIYRKKS